MTFPQHDPGDEQPALFDSTTTVPKKCSCGTTRKNLCAYDAAIEHGYMWKGGRPQSCLNSAQNRDGVPF